MKVITLTKKSIIKAIENGELATGGWVRKEDLPYIGDCEVCAVGAVFRHALKLPNDVLSRLVFTTGTSPDVSRYSSSRFRARKEALERGEWLSVLSDVFEDNAFDDNKYARKKRTIAFVRNHFPATVTIPEILLKQARDRAWERLKYNAYRCFKYEDFKHPFPKRKEESRYTEKEKKVLISAYGNFLKKRPR